MAEGYFQYAEHYFRVLNLMNQAATQQGQGGQGTARAARVREINGHQGGGQQRIVRASERGDAADSRR